MKKFIAYYRVSTKSQGQSGLGLESQKQEISTYVSSINGIILHSYTDVESGKNNNRENLWLAVAQAHKESATLIVKKFDRLSRGGLEIMSRLERLGINYIESDSPHDNTLLKELKFSIARDEVRKVSERTKAALKVIKDKVDNGIQHISKKGNVVSSLGNPSNLTSDARLRSIESKKREADNSPENIRAFAFISTLRDDAALPFSVITVKLNKAGFKTSRGNDFSEVQTKRIYERFKNDLITI